MHMDGTCSSDLYLKVESSLLLTSMVNGCCHRETLSIAEVQPITRYHAGLKAGPPRKIIDASFLQAAMAPQRHLSLSKLAKLIGVHRHTLRSYLRQYNIQYAYSDVSDEDLDRLVKAYRETRPESGIRYLIGFLRQNGLRLQLPRVKSSIQRIDPLGRAIRRRNPINRRNYKVPRPNALWHIDGHHKLIRWGIVIHGGVDGFCRTVRHMK